MDTTCTDCGRPSPTCRAIDGRCPACARYIDAYHARIDVEADREAAAILRETRGRRYSVRAIGPGRVRAAAPGYGVRELRCIGRYVYDVTDAPGTLGQQVGERLEHGGVMLHAADDLAGMIRREMRRRLRADARTE